MLNEIKKVALIYGGNSSEREISIKSGKQVEKALKELGYQIQVFDPIEPEKFIKEIKEFEPDKAFIVLHGKGGEDGTIQGVLDFLNIPYTGSGVKASAVAMDKALTKDILKSHNIPVPEGIVLFNKDQLNTQQIKLPAVVKANSEGSSIGVYIVKTKEELIEAVEKAFQLDNKVIIEQFIEGRELTVGVLNGKPLEIVEIIVKEGFYDFENKYISDQIEYVCPAKIDQKVYKTMQELALYGYNIIGCKGAVRVDFMLDKEMRPYVLEINTIPGMTDHSLLPKAAKASGINFHQLVEAILQGG